MIQHSTRSNYLHTRFNICMVIFDLATQPPFLPAPLMTDAGSSPGNRKPRWFSALEEDTELGKGPESRRSLGWGKAEVWETVPKSLQTDTGTGLWVTRAREVGACRVQVSLVGGPRQVSALQVRRGLRSADVAFRFYTPCLCSDGARPLTALAGESWLFSISWVPLSPKGSPTAPSPAVDGLLGMNKPSHLPGQEQVSPVCLPLLFVSVPTNCACSFGMGCLGKTWHLEETVHLRISSKGFSTFGFFAYYSSHNWTLNICYTECQYLCSRIVSFFKII